MDPLDHVPPPPESPRALIQMVDGRTQVQTNLPQREFVAWLLDLAKATILKQAEPPKPQIVRGILLPNGR